MQTRLKKIIVLAILAWLPGCGSWYTAPLSYPQINNKENIFVQPFMADYRNARVGMLMLRCQPELPQISYPITQIFYRQLLETRPFREVVVIPQPYTSLEEALRLTKDHKFDLLLLGEVPYFLDSGSTGKSGLQVDLKVVEPSSKRVLWLLSDAVSAAPRPIVDLWCTETDPRPSPSVYTLAESLACRMVHTLIAKLPEEAAMAAKPKGDVCPTWPAAGCAVDRR
ncbi:MAG: hypothetical protein AB1491_04445 [Thermodesulfobacteriota bacterium]